MEGQAFTLYYVVGSYDLLPGLQTNIYGWI